eukprot:PRCOL_00000022-RA
MTASAAAVDAPTKPPPERVVSLYNAATESLFLVGAGKTLVARSHGCDHPAAARLRPVVSKAKLDLNAGAAEIDAEVRVLAARQEQLYKVDSAVVEAANPALVIMQNQCSVCAVTPGIVDTDAPMLVLRPKTLEGVLDDVERVAAAWCAPIMGCADWLPEIVELAGGVPVHAAVDGKTPTLWGGVEELLSTPLDAIVLALCGFDASRVARELRRCPELLAALRGLEASGDTGVWVTDGSSLFNRSGPRVVESAEVLAEALHNGLLGHYGHAGTPYLLSLEETLALYPPEDGTDVPSAAAAADPTPARAAAVAGSAVGVEREKAPSPPKGKEAALEVVRAQLACLRVGGDAGVEAAFALCSAGNQERLGGPAQFGAVLRGHSTFAALLGPEAGEAEVLGATITAGCSEVSVLLEVGDGDRHSLLWTLERDAAAGGGWRTAGVAEDCS